MENKNILVIGLGMSGVSCVKAFNAKRANIFVYDSKTKEELFDKIKELDGINVTYYLDNECFDMDSIDLAVKSPGIKYETPVIQRLVEKNIKIISDIEAAYLMTENPIVSITGTNGKTTTTTLIGEIIKESGKKCKLTGNIGSGMCMDVLSVLKDEILVVEASSFQLAGTYEYKPHISIITNITPDHLDWHQTIENYIDAKFRNTINQDINDYAILNYEDVVIREKSKNIIAKKIFFSSERHLDEGICVENGEMIYRYNNDKQFIINIKDIFIPGKHNVENSLAAASAAIALGIDVKTINKVLREFRGVEHRLEFCGEYNSVKFYNDSKGTNPDASIKAIEGISYPIILIAGGYDKKSSYDEFIKAFDRKVKALILLGQTADEIEKCARKCNFNNIYKVSNMDEAVKKSYEISQVNDNVVLSPACASWGMYPNYEVRGRDFKERVKYYGGCAKLE